MMLGGAMAEERRDGSILAARDGAGGREGCLESERLSSRAALTLATPNLALFIELSEVYSGKG